MGAKPKWKATKQKKDEKEQKEEKPKNDEKEKEKKKRAPRFHDSHEDAMAYRKLIKVARRPLPLPNGKWMC